MTLNPEALLIPVLLPFLGGWILLCLPELSERKRNIFLEIFACFTSVIVFIMLYIIRGRGDAVYSFTKGFSIAFLIDGPAMLFAGMIAFMWPLALLYSFEYMRGNPRQNQFYAFYLMTYGITLGVAFSANLVTMYVFFEMLTLVTIPLVSYWSDPDSIYASRLYIGYCVFGASLAFIAVVMGTLDGIGDFLYRGNLAGEYNSNFMRIVYLCGFFGFGTKAAIFPFFEWLPKASVAPTPVTALLHAVAVVNTGAFAVLRLTWYAFGPALLSGSIVHAICVLTASFSMIFAAVMALRQRHFKRRLAYSTMSNLSYILFGVALLTPDGLWGGLAHMLFHGVIKMSLFLCAGAFMRVTGNEYLYELDGVGRHMPWTFTAYTLGALSLTGIPLFCGFISKWRLLTAGIAAGTPAAFIGSVSLIISAFLCALYSLTVSVRAFYPYGGRERCGPNIHEANWKMLVPIWIFAVFNIFFGLRSGFVMSFLESIAHGII